jgi:hypothetical protein
VKNQLLVRGLALVAIALFFGIPSFTYQVGTFSHAGPGLFPLLISGIVGLIGLVMIVRSRLERSEPMTFNFKNIAIVLASLVGFVLIAETLKVIAAIVFLVFFSTLAGSDYSIKRNLKICVVLIAIAFAFHTFLGLSLPLY